MTRLLLALGAIGAAVAGLLLWASARDLREPWVPFPDEDYMAAIQVDPRPYFVSEPVGGM